MRVRAGAERRRRATVSKRSEGVRESADANSEHAGSYMLLYPVCQEKNTNMDIFVHCSLSLRERVGVRAASSDYDRRRWWLGWHPHPAPLPEGEGYCDPASWRNASDGARRDSAQTAMARPARSALV